MGQFRSLDVLQSRYVQKRRPFDVGPEVLNPTLCLSSVGVSTGKAFSPALISPTKVHTNLVSMLIANEMTEEMIMELLGTGNAAPLMNSLLQTGEHALRFTSWQQCSFLAPLASCSRVTCFCVEQAMRQVYQGWSSTSPQQLLGGQTQQHMNHRLILAPR